MGTSAETVTLVCRVNHYGTVSTPPPFYSRDFNDLDPNAQSPIGRVWWSFSIDGDISNAISIEQIDINYTVSSHTGSPFGIAFKFQLMSGDDSVSAEELFNDIGTATSGDEFLGNGIATDGAHTSTLNSNATDDLLASINDGDSSWFFGGTITASFGEYTMLMDNTRSTTINSIDVNYTITVADPAPAVPVLVKSNITIVQPNTELSASTLLPASPEVSRVRYTSIKISNKGATHKETHFQIYDQNSPPGKGLLVSLRSKQNIRNNGNVPRLNKNELRIYLKFRTNYRLRSRIRTTTDGWGAWTPLIPFKTRSV